MTDLMEDAVILAKDIPEMVICGCSSDMVVCMGLAVALLGRSICAY